MNEVLEKEINIENMIYEIRGKQVMLDRDLAKLYQVETRILNQKVKRNIERFPEEFCFQMSILEFENWKSQIVMSESDKIGLRRPPYVFTEQGVAMLSAIISSDVAIDISIKIMKAFVEMKKYISTNLIEQRYINNQVLKNTENIKLLQESFSKFEEKRKVNEIYFDGQIYDAYSKILDILNEAKCEIIIIDAYLDKIVLDLIRNLKVKLRLITSFKSKLNKELINKYNKQYNNLEVIYNNSFHDRYFILDNKTVYHCGTSLNYIGKKTFSINKIEDDFVINSLIDRISNFSHKNIT